VPVRDVDILDLEKRGAVLSRCQGTPPAREGPSGPRRHALRDLLTEVQYRDELGEVHEHLDVVADDHDGHAGIPDAPDDLLDLFDFLGAHARRRLVQEQHLGRATTARAICTSCRSVHTSRRPSGSRSPLCRELEGALAASRVSVSRPDRVKGGGKPCPPRLRGSCRSRPP